MEERIPADLQFTRKVVDATDPGGGAARLRPYVNGVFTPWTDEPDMTRRGTNENTYGMLSQHFPKGRDLSRW